MTFIKNKQENTPNTNSADYQELAFLSGTQSNKLADGGTINNVVNDYFNESCFCNASQPVDSFLEFFRLISHMYLARSTVEPVQENFVSQRRTNQILLLSGSHSWRLLTRVCGDADCARFSSGMDGGRWQNTRHNQSGIRMRPCCPPEVLSVLLPVLVFRWKRQPVLINLCALRICRCD